MSRRSSTESLQLFGPPKNHGREFARQNTGEMGEAKPTLRTMKAKFKILLGFFPTSKTPVKKFDEEEKPSFASKLRAKPLSATRSIASSVSLSSYERNSQSQDKSSTAPTQLPGSFLPPKINENSWVLQKRLSQIEC